MLLLFNDVHLDIRYISYINKRIYVASSFVIGNAYNRKILNNSIVVRILILYSFYSCKFWHEANICCSSFSHKWNHSVFREVKYSKYYLNIINSLGRRLRRWEGMLDNQEKQLFNEVDIMSCL